MGGILFGQYTLRGIDREGVKLQGTKAGTPRPIVFGTARPIIGAVIATTPPHIVKYRDKTAVASGGGIFSPLISGPKVIREDIYRTYAIRICEGPVDAVTRIWRNGELFFVNDPTNYIDTFYPDASEEKKVHDIETLFDYKFSLQTHAEIFLGTFDQMPSATMQAAFGMENVHAYRGTCYAVIENDLLNSTGGAIPQYLFEVCRGPDTPMMFDAEGEKQEYTS